MNILSLSDQVIPFIYSPMARQRFPGVDLVIGCGDLDYDYLEYVNDILNTSLFFVHGNHDQVIDQDLKGKDAAPRGAINLHRNVIHYCGTLLAGVEGCLRYSNGNYQYTQSEMWGHVFHLVPGLLLNRLRFGRFLDIFVTHAPAQGIQDMTDLPHQGIRAFRWLIEVFQPAYHLHGHIHLYNPMMVKESQFGRTRVVNCFGYYQLEL
jgi:uncharacterized protein